MTRPVNTDTFAGATGRSWEQWLDFLRSIGAQALSHGEIAQRVEATGDASAWWAQMITVAFEQHIGRRMPGQAAGGDFQLGVSRTLAVPMDEALARWLAVAGSRSAFDEVPLAGDPEVSRTEDWRYWRASLADGSRIVVQVHRKSAGKSALTITHERVDSHDSIAVWRAYWKALISTV